MVGGGGGEPAMIQCCDIEFVRLLNGGDAIGMLRSAPLHVQRDAVVGQLGVGERSCAG